MSIFFDNQYFKELRLNYPAANSDGGEISTFRRSH